MDWTPVHLRPCQVQRPLPVPVAGILDRFDQPEILDGECPEWAAAAGGHVTRWTGGAKDAALPSQKPPCPPAMLPCRHFGRLGRGRAQRQARAASPVWEDRTFAGRRGLVCSFSARQTLPSPPRPVAQRSGCSSSACCSISQRPRRSESASYRGMPTWAVWPASTAGQRPSRSGASCFDACGIMACSAREQRVSSACCRAVRMPTFASHCPFLQVGSAVHPANHLLGHHECAARPRNHPHVSSDQLCR